MSKLINFDELNLKRPHNIIDIYKAALVVATDKNIAREYIAEFLRSHSGSLVRIWFQEALEKVRPDLLEWFKRIQVLE